MVPQVGLRDVVGEGYREPRVFSHPSRVTGPVTRTYVLTQGWDGVGERKGPGEWESEGGL